MATFNTQIVEGRKVPLIFRILVGSILLLSAYFLYIDRSFLDTSMEIIFTILYLLCMISAFGINLLKPKLKGELELDASFIRFQIANSEKTVYFSEIENLRFQYKTYGGWWSHNFYGNDNILSFKTNDGEEFSFEILLKDKNHKEKFKELISIQDPEITTRGLNVGRAAF